MSGPGKTLGHSPGQSELAPEVVVFGRAGVDLYPASTQTPLREVDTFRRFLGGSPSNVAVGIARLGHSVSMVTVVADDPFGEFIREEFTRLGVGISQVRTTTQAPTTLAFCELFPPDHFPLHFVISDTPPDSFLRPADVPEEWTQQARAVWVSLSGLAKSPGAEAHRHALEVRGRREHTIVDLDYRESFWPSEAAARERGLEAISLCDTVIANRREGELVVGQAAPEDIARAFLDLGASVAIIKLGPEGLLAATREETLRIPAQAPQVVNGLGAGDAFGAAYVHGRLTGQSLTQTLGLANTAGAIVASRLECSTAMPTVDELAQWSSESA